MNVLDLKTVFHYIKNLLGRIVAIFFEKRNTLLAYTRLFFNGLCRGKAMVAYIKTQHRRKEESEQLRG